MNKTKMILMLSLLTAMSSMAQSRKVVELKDNWLFSRDNQKWTKVSIPHDWAIAGPFDKKWDLQYLAIRENGERKKDEKSGRTGALPWIGTGAYQTTFSVPKGYARA